MPSSCAGAPSSAPSPTRARREGDGGGAQARALSDGGAVPGSAAASAAPPPASRQSPRALASGPLHTGRRPCVRTSLSPPPSAGPSTAPGPRAAGGQWEPVAAAPPRRSRRFGSAYAPKRSVTCPLSASASHGYWKPLCFYFTIDVLTSITRKLMVSTVHHCKSNRT